MLRTALLWASTNPFLARRLPRYALVPRATRLVKGAYREPPEVAFPRKKRVGRRKVPMPGAPRRLLGNICRRPAVQVGPQALCSPPALT